MPYSQRNREIVERRPRGSKIASSERREEDGRAEGDRLHSGREREPDQREQEDDAQRHRTFEHDEEHEHDNEEERVEGVLRHDGARVRERGHGTARSAARSARPSRTTRRAMENAGIAARDISTAFVVFTAAYASGRRSNSA